MKSLLRKADWRVLLLALAVGGMLAGLSVARYRGYNAGMNDLGNMSQAIWSGTQGQPLVVTSDHGPLSRLALHVELFYFLLVPLYALFPSPVTLLIFQAAMFAAGAFPLYALARRRLASISAALAITATYLFYPVAQTAVLFDFHGDTLAMPLLLFAIEALDRQAWKNYALWIALALSCKLYVAAPVSALGVMLWLQGRRRVGTATFLVGVGWGAVAFWGVRALFAPAAGGAVAITAGGYFSFYFGTLWQELSASWLARSLVAGIVFLPVAVIVWRAPLWLLPAAAVGLPALLSTGPGPSYYYGHHHYALVVPFLMSAVVYGSVRVKRQPPALRTFVLLVGLMLTILLNSFFVDTPLNPNFWRAKGGQGLAATKYGRTSRDALKDLWLRTLVPEGSPLAASVMLAPHLTNRSTLYLTDYLPEHSGDIMVAVPDALFDYVDLFVDGRFKGGALHDVSAICSLLESPDFGLVAAQDGLLLFQRDPPSASVLLQTVAITSDRLEENPIAVWDDRVALLDWTVTPLGERRFCLHYTWHALSDLTEMPPMFAVTRLQGVPDARIMHLPTLALHPTSAWEANQVVRETFEIVVPADIPAGTYPLRVGWYDSANWLAFATDARSCVDGEVQVGVLELP